MRYTKLITASALAGILVAGTTAIAETQQIVTEKTTTYQGVVSEVDPASSTIILRSESAPAPTRYTYNNKTVFVDSQGKIVTYETVKDSPVTVSYIREGDRTIITRVEATGPRVHKETTTTTTTETR